MKNIYQIRKFNTDKSCTGDFYSKDIGFHYACLEDPVRDEKIPKITAFQEGVYKLGIREVESPLTLKYRDRFDWFEFHIEIQGVPEYKYLYIHVMNTAEDSDGCVGIGMSRGKDRINSSVSAYTDFYERVYPLLKSGEKIWLHVENCF